MLNIRKELHITPSFDFGLLGVRKEDVLFFDIETTGLSPHTAALYLIGALQWENDGWVLYQFFVDGVQDELPVLLAFFDLLKGRKMLISYNGDSFDIPFLEKVVRQYGMESTYSFSSVESFDLYRQIRPVRKLIGLPDCRLKTCESFLGIRREDRFGGGELIYVYYEYLKDHDPDKLRLLLLHNAEDLENLPFVLPMAAYSFFLSSPFRLVREELVTLPEPDGSGSGSGTEKTCLSLTYLSDVSVPRPADISRGRFTLSISGQEINLAVELFRGTCLLFFPDYRNYYYLPLEDCAVHKSVAAFVDPSSRKKATASTCYQKKEGLFLPQLRQVFHPVFQREYRGKVYYTPYTPAMFSDPVKAEAYLRTFLSLFT